MPSRYSGALLLGLDEQTGGIGSGRRLDLILVDDGLCVVESWIGGCSA